MWKAFATIAVVAVGGLLAYAATRPDQFRVERSVLVQTPPERLYALVADLRQFNRWNPFDKKDPQIKGRYSGPDAGPGATYDFEGNGEVGKGRLAITGVAPAREVTMQLDMHAPIAARNRVVFTLEPESAGTRVRWAMQGESSFVAKLMHVFFDMDRMVGGEFEAGLASLKALAEAR